MGDDVQLTVILAFEDAPSAAFLATEGVVTLQLKEGAAAHPAGADQAEKMVFHLG
jgi:hypothetical protein